MKIGRLNRASFAKTARRVMLLFAFAALGVQAEAVATVGEAAFVTVTGIAGFADRKFASFAEAYEAIKPEIQKLGLDQESATAEAFDALFTSVDANGNATLTYTISGTVVYDETDCANLLTMGRKASHYGNGRHLINFKFVGATGKEADTLTVNSDITLPYEWWGEKTTTGIHFENLTITGSAPNGLYPSQPFFEGIDFSVSRCALKGIKIYNCSNVKGSYTITDSVLDGTGAPANSYAIHLQGNETAPLSINIRGNTISGYDRGINIDQKTAVATIKGNTISVKDAGRSCIQLTSLATAGIVGNTLELTGGNAITLHKNLLGLSPAPEVSISGNNVKGRGYLVYDDAVANDKEFTSDSLKLTYATDNVVAATVDTTKGVKEGRTYGISTAVNNEVQHYVATVGTTGYTTLAAALAAVAEGKPLTWVAEGAWPVETPVYYNGTFYETGTGFAAKGALERAIDAANAANAAAVAKIYVRPGYATANGLVVNAHQNIKTSIAIFGNDASLGLTGWEPCVEYPGENYHTLTKDVSIEIYNLHDGAGVWGQRLTTFTVTVTMADCRNVHEVLLNGQYATAAASVNNFTIRRCTFDGVNGAASCPVTTTSAGRVVVEGCAFANLNDNYVVNMNNKNGGKTEVAVKDCSFTNCGATGKEVVRLTGEAEGSKVVAELDKLTFDAASAANAIIVGNKKTENNKASVSYTITRTSGTMNVYKQGVTTAEATTLDATAEQPYTGSNVAENDGSEAHPYSREQFAAMTRAEYIAAQARLAGTLYVNVGNYAYETAGVLGNGVRNDTPGQVPDHSKLNAYGENGYLGEKNDGANGHAVVFVGGTITSGATGYTSIDNIGTSLLLAVPAYTKVTFKGTAFKNVLSFDYQLYTSPWSQLGGLTFQNCTFDGIIVGAIAAQELAFNGCTFNNYENTTSANNSNPTWIRPAYGNWTKGDNEGQGEDFRSLTKITFENNTVTSTRPVKFERIAQWEMATTVKATGNTFAITPQAGDTSTKNVGLYFGANAKFDLVIENNEKSDGTAALYTAVYSAPTGVTYVGLPAGSTVKNAAGEATSSNDALAWKTNNQITLETTAAVASVAKIGDDEYETLKDAYAAANDGDVIQLVAGEVDATASGTLSTGASKKVTIRGVGMDKTIVNWGNGRIGADAGSDYVFEDLTLVIDHKGAGMPYTDCFWHPKSETFTRVQINGAISTMDPAVFDHCVFNGSTTGDEYLLYQYDSTLEVKNCRFVKAGSKGSIKLYAEAGNALTTVVTDCVFDAVGSKGSAIYTSNSNNAGETTQVVYDITHSGVTVPEGKEVVLASGNGVSVVNAEKDEDGKYVSGLFLSANTNAETVEKIIANVAAENLVAAKEDGKPQWSLAPAKTAVAKIGDDEYETLQAALDAAKTGDTVTLLSDITLTDYVLDKSVTIRCAGETRYEIKGLKAIAGSGAALENVFLNLDQTLDIGGTDTTLNNCVMRAKDVGYSDIVNGNTTGFTGGKVYQGNAFTYLVRVSGTRVALTDCRIDGTDKDESYFPNMCLAPVSGSDVTMTRCTFNEGFAACYYSTPSGTWTLEDCTFTKIFCYNIQADDTAAKIVVKGCSLAGWTSFGSSMAEVSFENCAFAKSSGYATIVAHKNATFSGCTFTEDYKDNLYIEANTAVDLNGCSVVDGNGQPSATVSLPEIVALDDATAFAALDATKDADGKYTAGKFVAFSTEVLRAHCAAGYEPVTNGDGTYVLKKVAHVVAITLGGAEKAMPFPVTWLAANISEDASKWTTEELEKKAVNGLAKWQCYLFGLDPSQADAKVVATAGQGTEAAIPLAVANADASDSPLVTGGYVTVAYVLMGSNDMGSNDGTAWTQVAASNTRDGLAIPLTGTTYKFYRVDVTVTSAEGN